jgi:hypothetical protein
MHKRLLTKVLSFGLVATSSQAAILWTGGGATDDFYDPSNWDFSGSASSGVTSPTDDNIIIAGATINESSGSFSNIEIGDTLSVLLDDTTFRFTNSNGFSGVDDAGDVVSTLSVTNGSSFNAQFATLGIEVLIDGTSSVEFRGAGDPINSQTERTRIILEPGATLTLPSTAEFTEQGADIFVGEISFADNPSILSFNGTTATAIPEPTSFGLVVLGGLAFLRRRR